MFRENGRVTAGNASQVSDGAAAIVVMSGEKAEELGVRRRARVIDQVTLGVDPITMLTGPIPATARILERNGLSIGDIDVIEVNEAFASVLLAWRREAGEADEAPRNRGSMIIDTHIHVWPDRIAKIALGSPSERGSRPLEMAATGTGSSSMTTSSTGPR